MSASSGVRFDEKTTKIIERLRTAFNVKSNAEVIERALILAQIAAVKADKDHNIIIGSGDNIEEIEKINIAT